MAVKRATAEGARREKQASRRQPAHPHQNRKNHPGQIRNRCLVVVVVVSFVVVVAIDTPGDPAKYVCFR